MVNRTERFTEYGQYLRKIYDEGKDAKLNGITYRLLNALKVKDVSRFMDTLINAYTYKREVIPVEFTKALEDTDKFQAIGYAFLIGLQGYKDNMEKKGEN